MEGCHSIWKPAKTGKHYNRRQETRLSRSKRCHPHLRGRQRFFYFGGVMSSIRQGTTSWQKPLDLEFFEKNPRVNGKRVFAAVAFGDTTSFKKWTNHPFSTADKHTRFMVQLYDQFLRFRNGSGYFVKILGDGLLAVKELPDPSERKELILEMMAHATGLVRGVERLIERINYPRPKGFRIRLVAGDILRLEASDPNNKGIKQIDYADYPVDLAHSLLQMHKDLPFVCHESVRECVSPPGKKNRVAFTPLSPPGFCPEGIEEEDLKVLWSFKCRRMLRSPH